MTATTATTPTKKTTARLRRCRSHTWFSVVLWVSHSMCVCVFVPTMLIFWYVFFLRFFSSSMRLFSSLLFVYFIYFSVLDLTILLRFFLGSVCDVPLVSNIYLSVNSFLSLVYMWNTFFFGFVLFRSCFFFSSASFTIYVLSCLFLIQTICWNVDRIPCNFL